MKDPDAEITPTGTVDESSLEPVGRDRRFIVRLVLSSLVGLVAAVWVGAWLRRSAGSCGASLVRPGSTVIPAARDHSSQRRP